MRAQHFLALFLALAPFFTQAEEKDLPPKDRDPRLPPVLPGEVVETESGQKIKVWSSAGPVSINTPPAAQTIQVPGIFLDNRNQQVPIRDER